MRECLLVSSHLAHMVSRPLETNQCEINEYSRKERFRRGMSIDDKNKGRMKDDYEYGGGEIEG